MGTINYGSNCTNEGLLNIGLNLNRFNSPITIMRRANMMREIVDDYNGTWFKVNVEPGYYEGAWVSVEWDEDILFYNGPWSFEEVRSEITYLNTMLQLLVNAGCVEYWPGWCTGYSTAAETRKAIIANVERLWTYYKETYQEDEGDD
jgi:hypothetical protein